MLYAVEVVFECRGNIYDENKNLTKSAEWPSGLRRRV